MRFKDRRISISYLTASEGLYLIFLPTLHRSAPQAAYRSSADVTPLCLRGMRRSEEHTSELQSRLHLVCRLLLEKKKQHTYRCYSAHGPPYRAYRLLLLCQLAR